MTRGGDGDPTAPAFHIGTHTQYLHIHEISISIDHFLFFLFLSLPHTHTKKIHSYNSPGQFSIGRSLQVGDVITVTLQEDNTLSFRCNGKYFTHPLRPAGTLFPVVMFCGEVKIEIGPEKA